MLCVRHHLVRVWHHDVVALRRAGGTPGAAVMRRTAILWTTIWITDQHGRWLARSGGDDLGGGGAIFAHLVPSKGLDRG